MEKILNLGCGNDMYGTHRIDVFKTPATTEVGDLNKKLPYPDNYFDKVIMSGVLEHLKNIGLVLEEVYRVLKRGGRLWIRTDHAGFILFHTKKKMEHNEITRRWYAASKFGHDRGEDNHYHLFVESHLRRLLKEYKKVDIGYFYMNPYSLKGKILKILPYKLGASQIEAEAIK